jgi:hypothetical protein
MAQLDYNNATSVNTNQSLSGPKDRPKMVAWQLVAQCKDERDAIVLCVNLSKLAHSEIADQLHIDKGYFSRIMSGRVSLPAHKRCQLMALCGNVAPVQFENMKLGYQMFENQLDREEQRLEAQLASLRLQKEQMLDPFLKAA